MLPPGGGGDGVFSRVAAVVVVVVVEGCCVLRGRELPSFAGRPTLFLAEEIAIVQYVCA